MITTARGATFSDCGRYRFRLWRTWDYDKPAIAFCMLNPSTADELNNDPTVERCERRAREWGKGGLEVVNLFALRSTDPQALYEHKDPIGGDNRSFIIGAALGSEYIVCAWGAHGKHLHAGSTMLEILQRQCPSKIRVLKLNADGMPAHPLYLPYSLKPVRYVKTLTR